MKDGVSLFDGDIVEVPPESPQNVLITMFLMAQFFKQVPFD